MILFLKAYATLYLRHSYGMPSLRSHSSQKKDARGTVAHLARRSLRRPPSILQSVDVPILGGRKVGLSFATKPVR